MKYLPSITIPILITCSAFFYPTVKASSVPSEKQTIFNSLRDSIKALDSSIQTSVSNNPFLCLTQAKRAMSYSRLLNTPEDLAHGYSLMGQAYFIKDKDSSYIYFNKAMKLADSAKLDGLKPMLLYHFGSLYKAAKDNKQAIIFLDSCIKTAKFQKDYYSIARSYNLLGNIYIEIRNNENAMTMYDSAFSIAGRFSIPTQQGIAIANIARFEKDPVKAYQLEKEAIKFLKKNKGIELALARLYINIGFRDKNPDTAIVYFKKALELTKENHIIDIELGAYNNMVYSYLEKGNIAAAEECLIGHAIPMAERERNHDWLSTLSDTYSEVLTKKGDYKGALRLQKTAMKERITADNTQASDQIRLLSVLLDLKSKELTIQDNQREILVQQNRLQKTRLGLTITIFMIIGFVFIILWLQQRNRVKLQIQQIQSAKRIIEIEENEKARIARELHDITGQLVLGITGEIENIDIQDDNVKSNIQGKIRELGKNIRSISHRMNKAMLDSFTFEELIYGQCEDIKKAVGLNVDLRMPAEPVVLNEEMVLHPYRIVQELLTNAGKYASDCYVSLSFQHNKSELSIDYFDNGPGFDPENIGKKGMGLMNIFERAKLMNGSAKLTSAPGDGVTWAIRVPIHPDKA